MPSNWFSISVGGKKKKHRKISLWYRFIKTIGQDIELAAAKDSYKLRDVVGINYWDLLKTSLQTACILNISCNVFYLTVNSSVSLPVFSHSGYSKNTVFSKKLETRWILDECTKGYQFYLFFPSHFKSLPYKY